jgi:hypothetical protein
MGKSVVNFPVLHPNRASVTEKARSLASSNTSAPSSS